MLTEKYTLEKKLENLRGRLALNEPLAEYTSWRVGGPADFLYIPADVNDLSIFLQQLPENCPLLWLGLGSNVLIRDGGVNGAVIVTQGALHEMSQLDVTRVRAEAGVSCAQFARYSARLGLTGAEFMAGIPGTVGGALAMNAGCYGGETWQRVHAVETVDRQGKKRIREAADFEVAYRHVKRPQDEWFVAGHFELMIGDKTKALADIKSLLAKRNAAQPTGLPNCGSVFRNPPDNYAARLIEQCGLKKTSIGGAYVSEKHANFIINGGDATANDIESLILHVHSTVEKQQGVKLIPEVCIIGNAER
ncbi:MAG: UDP-N-acetylmuramate dehydrogenase [Gammaproteobacteria bacterium]